MVTFNVTSDEVASFHLHGYDHELELAPQVMGSVRFTADATGSFPITIHVRAESSDEEHDAISGGDGHHEKTIEAPVDMSVGVVATLDELSGVNLKITTTGFTFTPENAGGEHVPGEGHAHVYVDGVKINRVYGSYYHLSGLDPGERSIRITLNANSHEQYAKGEHPVEATTTIVCTRRSSRHVRPPRRPAVGVGTIGNRPGPPGSAPPITAPRSYGRAALDSRLGKENSTEEGVTACPHWYG